MYSEFNYDEKVCCTCNSWESCERSMMGGVVSAPSDQKCRCLNGTSPHYDERTYPSDACRYHRLKNYY